MFKLIPFFTLLVILLPGYSFDANTQVPVKWVISGNGYLKVGGTTNINKFNCAIANYIKPDTISFFKNSASGALKLTGLIHLDLQRFDCHNKMMTKDLRKTLKATDFPQLIIRFISLSKYPDLDKDSEAKGIVVIGLAGVTRQFEMDYRFMADGGKSIALIGSHKINFSDFNLIPPKKMGGVIKTNNELAVEFSLKMRVLD